jgi:undecaprenyl-diphosphatase
METAILVWIHGWSGPFLDAAFRVSHELGNLPFCSLIVGLACLWHLARGERGEALLWLVLGLSTFALFEGLKVLVLRPRPHLWPPLVTQTGYAFPSGHALAAATFYPLLAVEVSRRRPAARPWAWTLALGLAFFVGLGRLYLGVHWPTDVLAGWALGAGQTALGLHLLGPHASAEA